jgi:hypothetical protein
MLYRIFNIRVYPHFKFFIENAKAFSDDLFSIAHHFLTISQKIILITEK